MSILFRKNKELEVQIDDYLDLVVNGGLMFKTGLRLYLQDRPDEFHERLTDLRAAEQRADELRRGIVGSLYRYTLIPESRGDVLGLLESSDKVINLMTATLLRYDVELPEMVLEGNDLLLELADSSVLTEENMVKSIRAYFRDISAVRDHINQVQFARQETSRLAEKYKRMVFRMDLRLSHKNQLRNFADQIDDIADEAEDVTDRVAIAAIKRSL